MNRRALRRLGKVAVLMFFVSHVAWAGITMLWYHLASQELANEQERCHELQQRFDEAAAAFGKEATAEPRVPRWTLLADADVTGTLHVLELVSEGAGVQVSGVKPVPTNQAGKQGFRITGHGTPTAICRFLATLEGHKRLMIVETGKIAPADAARLTFEFGIATFHATGAGQ